MKLQPIGANQTVLRFDDKSVLFSYQTPVACIIHDTAYRTDKHWSKTTTKHINQWLKDFGLEDDEWVETKPQTYFDNLVAGE